MRVGSLLEGEVLGAGAKERGSGSDGLSRRALGGEGLGAARGGLALAECGLLGEQCRSEGKAGAESGPPAPAGRAWPLWPVCGIGCSRNFSAASWDPAVPLPGPYPCVCLSDGWLAG